MFISDLSFQKLVSSSIRKARTRFTYGGGAVCVFLVVSVKCLVLTELPERTNCKRGKFGPVDPFDFARYRQGISLGDLIIKA